MQEVTGETRAMFNSSSNRSITTNKIIKMMIHITKDHPTISHSNIREAATKAAEAVEAKEVVTMEEAIKIKTNIKAGIKVETEVVTHNNINQRE